MNIHKPAWRVLWRLMSASAPSITSGPGPGGGTHIFVILRNTSTNATKKPTTLGKKQNRIPASYYRGGTSRGLIFHANDLPPNRANWAPIFQGTLGSPDPNGRQLDGLGGGISSLSKICVVGPSMREDAQVDFTFVQVGVKDGEVDYSGNCGNLMSAIGPYAVDSGIVAPAVTNSNNNSGNPESANITVRIFNTNTEKLIDATFPVCDGEAAVAYGDFAIDGVASAGAKIKLDFLNPAGSKTGKMLPTGNIIDVFDGVRTTCIDVGNPCIFIPASELGMDGTALPDKTSQNSELLSRLERLRVQATIKMGMATCAAEVPASIPKVCFVSPPLRHKLVSGQIIEADEVDIIVRAISVGQPHKALPITAGLAMCAASGIEGSIVQSCLSSSSPSSSFPSSLPARGECELVVGHASGKLTIGATFVGDTRKSDERVLERVTVYRTARRLMDGVVYWK